MTSSNDGPNRNRGSIRSIMTLPMYHPSPRADEQLIAREGERAGIDTVIEYPETLEEEETRREEDMAALYEIRQARRREIEDREERRRARAEARENSDWARLEQLRLEHQTRQRAQTEASRARNNASGSSLTLLPTVSPAAMPELGVGGNGSSQTLIAEHNARASSHERRISSVSYAELGLARHDGSRLRQDSLDSDHRPLLDGAAFMGSGAAGLGSNNNSRPGSLFNPNIVPLNGRHHRAVSAESVVTTASEFAGAAGPTITPQTSAGNRSDSDTAIRTPSASESTPPAPPMEDPPQYEDAPPYTSPVAAGGEDIPRLPSLHMGDSRLEPQLPSIEVSASTPVLGNDGGELGGRR